ncbi:hypothetical protein F0P96_16620 [Hymenobacter busanensis]|uniref:Uncharacterized protein n=1 Tax=Hymenobacter busanensis TaxID=2607656 RepID=A0A7L4ZS25_9BACT|nr:hypothetical protein [Hymenobacter busanensis]KAA9327602.1 hypothetical protein F0P96_16620 [Hymenobacter busanensis]QHJ06059.1 hypothetical protein GUY19_01615 [Hymenobacter busanensis]
MKTPFRLDEHPRRPQPLAPPPDAYFDKLPLRIMQRVQPAPQAESLPAFGWLLAWPAPLRTALASVVVLLGFVGAFWLTNDPLTFSHPVAVQRASASQALAAVPRAELVQYLTSDAAPQVALTDLAETAVADQDLTHVFLPGSPADIQAALDEQPTEDVYL